MTITAATGAKIFIGGVNSTRNPTLQDYQEDSYVEIGEVENMGEFGDQSGDITFTSLSDSRVRKLKGPRDAGTMPLTVGDDMTDEGQTAMVAAEATPFDYKFYVQLNDALSLGGEGSKHYFAGKVMSKRRNVGDANSVVRRAFSIGINTEILEVEAT